MRVLVLLNAAAGTLAASSDHDEPARIASEFARHGCDADVRAVPGDEIATVAREAAASRAVDLIVAGGGDGTINTVANSVIGSGVPFAVLPLGTFNHLAKELEIPLELPAAIEAIATGREVPFNVGKVNDRHFLSFAAVGIYSDLIRHRDAQRKTLGRKKMWAGTIAAFKLLFRWPLRHVTIRFGDAKVVDRKTPFVYVSLSGLQLDAMGVADRPAFARDALNVIVALEQRRLDLLWLMTKSLLRRVRMGRDVESFRTDAIALSMRRRRHAHVGFDGEVESMPLPLRIALVPNGLTMRVPEAASKYVRPPDLAAAPAAVG